jgi:hypothetical protein
VSEVLDPAATPRAAIPLPQQAATPSMLLAMAVQQGADLDRLERLMALQERWDANEARKAFVEAMTAFKAEPLEIFKRKQVEFTTRDGDTTSYKHATLADVTDVVVPAMARHGLSHRWDVEQRDGRIFVSCVVTHRAGHSEMVKLDAAPDASGKKNAIQQVASAIQYLQRYSLLAIVGLATKDTNDDDGRGSGEPLDDNKAAEVSALVDRLKAEVQQTTTDKDALEFFKKNKAQFANYPHAYQEFYDATVAHRKTLATKKPATEGAAQ